MLLDHVYSDCLQNVATNTKTKPFSDFGPRPKRNKIHHYPTRNCDKHHIQSSTDSFSNVSARNWNVITTSIDVNISFMQFKIVLKLYLHENEVILKYTK